MQRKMIAAALLSTCLMISCTHGQEATKIEPGSKASLDAQKKVRQALDKRIPKLEIKNQTFAGAIEYMRKISGVNIHVNWCVLDKEIANVKNRKINVALKNVSFKKALRIVLDEAGGEDIRLGYILDDGILVISTKERADWEGLVSRVYPIADLLYRYKTPDIPWLEVTAFPSRNEQLPITKEKSADGKPVTDSLTDSMFDDNVFQEKEETAKIFIRLLKENIERDSWYPDGLASINISGTNLIITQTHKNHELIEQMLQMLRRAGKAQKVSIGFAVIRLKDIKAARALRGIVAKGGDVEAALVDGEDEGLWKLNRCQDEQIQLGCVLRASHSAQHQYLTNEKDPDTKSNFVAYSPEGYEIGVLVKSREKKAVSISMTCGATWAIGAEDINKDTPRVNRGLGLRRNTFNFDLQPGRGRLLPVIPLTAADGGVKVVIWLPKTAAKAKVGKK